MKSAIRFSVMGLALALAVSGCGGTKSETSDGETVTVPAGTPPIWSLTGLPGPDDAQIQPIVVVKIENDPIVRPQTGLDRADLIFEELVEGGMTRFAVIYQSDLPDEVGPVRSVRHVDVAIAEPIADAFVFSGGARRTMKFVKRKIPTSISVINEGAPGMYRKPGVSAPHDLFLKMSEMLDSIAPKNTLSTGFFVRPELKPVAASASPTASSSTSASPKPSSTALTGKPVTQVGLKFSSFSGPSWKWNAADKMWMRSEGIKPFLNKDGTQFGTNNLVIIEVREIDAGYKGQTGGYVPRTVLTGSGRAWVLSDGKAVEVAWKKPFVDAQMELTDLDGNPFTMPTGRTWVELLPVVAEGQTGFTGEYSFNGTLVALKDLPLPAATPEPSDSATP
ncbi:MAG: DUF3048 domain-containing protein [Actinobacteria bacterium]|nr:DUF3048 domain-containing protein [Actinomycetota bacterium]